MSKKKIENIERNIKQVNSIDTRNVYEPPENRDVLSRFLREKRMDNVWKDRKKMKRR